MNKNLFIESLSDSNPAMREYAALGLMWYSDLEAITALADTLMNDSSWPVRRAAAKSLGVIGSPNAEQVLVQALGDGDVEVRVAAIIALGDIGSISCIPKLDLVLGDDSLFVRDLALRAIEKITARDGSGGH